MIRSGVYKNSRIISKWNCNMSHVTRFQSNIHGATQCNYIITSRSEIHHLRTPHSSLVSCTRWDGSYDVETGLGSCVCFGATTQIAFLATSSANFNGSLRASAQHRVHNGRQRLCYIDVVKDFIIVMSSRILSYYCGEGFGDIVIVKDFCHVVVVKDFVILMS